MRVGWRKPVLGDYLRCHAQRWVECRFGVPTKGKPLLCSDFPHHFLKYSVIILGSVAMYGDVDALNSVHGNLTLSNSTGALMRTLVYLKTSSLVARTPIWNTVCLMESTWTKHPPVPAPRLPWVPIRYPPPKDRSTMCTFKRLAMKTKIILLSTQRIAESDRRSRYLHDESIPILKYSRPN